MSLKVLDHFRLSTDSINKKVENMMDLTADIELETMRRQNHRCKKGIRGMLRRIVRHLVKLRRPKILSPSVAPLSEPEITTAWECGDNLFYYFKIVDNYYYQLVTKVNCFLISVTYIGWCTIILCFLLPSQYHFLYPMISFHLNFFLVEENDGFVCNWLITFLLVEYSLNIKNG